MQNLSFNDLIGLPYQWGAAPWSGKTDCFQLACEVHKRLGFADYSNQFEWVYELFDEQHICQTVAGAVDDRERRSP
jgi:hypothetical protein